MKKIVLLLILIVVSAFAENILPENWSSDIRGIEVTEKDLGKYVGEETIEGGLFWEFNKEYNGKTYVYYVRKDPREGTEHYLVSSIFNPCDRN